MHQSCQSWCIGLAGTQPRYSIICRDVTVISKNLGNTPLPLLQKITGKSWIRCGLSTPTSKQLECDGIGEWHPSSFSGIKPEKPSQAVHEWFCQNYRYKVKGGSRCRWGSRTMKRLVETGKSSQSKKNRISPDQQNYLLHLKFGSIKSQRSGYQIAMRFRKVNVIRDGDSKLLLR